VLLRTTKQSSIPICEASATLGTRPSRRLGAMLVLLCPTARQGWTNF
jgi:hypothetical protein